jgi:hypothetical protein
MITARIGNMIFIMNSDNMVDKDGGFSFRRIFRAILIGIGGNIILLLFLMTFLHIFEVIRFLPWIIAFNTAHTGYSLVDKTGKPRSHRKLVSALAGISNVLITTGILTLLVAVSFGDLILGFRDIGLFIVVGVLCSVGGTLLAARYYKLETS